MRLALKLGGAGLATPAGRGAVATLVAAAQRKGHEVLLVHGGGPQMGAWCERLDLPVSRVDGMRVTDADVARVATAVLGGEVGRELVRTLASHDVSAVSMTGADGQSYCVRPHASAATLGRVGEVHAINTTLIDALLAQGHVPVLSSIAPLHASFEDQVPGDTFWNINADSLAAPIAAAVHANALVFLTDTQGVLDGHGAVVRTLTQTTILDSVHGGMRTKVLAALLAAQTCPQLQVHIGSAEAGLEDLLAGRSGTRCMGLATATEVTS
jgi:acetylglutamate kinase